MVKTRSKCGDLSAFELPRQHRAEIVDLGVEKRRPDTLFRAPLLVETVFDADEEPPRQGVHGSIGFFVRRELFESIGANGVEHPKARLAGWLVDLHQQALVEQRCHPVEGIERWNARHLTKDVSRRFDGAAAGEDREPAKERALVVGQQVIAPPDGIAHGAQSVRHVPPFPIEQREAVDQAEPGSPAGESTLTRDAASSTASGRPSSRMQMSATAAAVSGVTEKSGLTAWARCMKSWADSERSNWSTVE